MNAIVTITFGEKHEHLAKLTHPTMEAYAKRVGAEFIVIKNRSWPDPRFEKFQLSSLLNKYQRIVYFDTDIIIRPDCPNLFDVVPHEQIGLFNEAGFIDHSEDIRQILKEMGVPQENWEKQYPVSAPYYNLGVIVASRVHKFIFSRPEKDIRNPSSLINLRLSKDKRPVHSLDYKLNRMNFIDRLTGEHRRASHIVHYANAAKNIPFPDLMRLIASDLQDWSQKSPDFNYRRNILVKTHGGLGDEICAEPVIRYLVEHSYKDANIVVATWFPRLFSHLPVKIVDITSELKLEPDTPYFLMECLVSPDNLAWKFMSANLMSGTDFMSQNCLRMILPEANKQIKLKIDFNDVQEALSVVGHTLTNLVLIHPGLGWPSKTFPADYWNSIIKQTVSAGFKVALIGKNVSDDQGTVDVEVPEGVIDTRNLLSLGGLFALISQAKVLVSNDSSPIHIAGAFDNHIILIPTCKHPDHVLPVRNSSKYHKAVSLHGKKLFFDEVDSTPTQIHGQTIDKVRGNILDYLPDPEVVVSAVKKVF